MEQPCRAPWPARIVAFAARRYPFSSGCGTLANSRVLRGLAGRGVVRARVRGGLRMLARVDDYVGRAIFYFGDLDPKVSWIFRRLLRPGDTLVDIGANQGLLTMLGASLVGVRGRVLAFEPQSALASLAERSARDAGLSQVSVQRAALSDEPGELSIFVPADNSGAARLGAGDGRPGSTETVPVRVGDIALAELGVQRARLIKVDVEGHEPKVFAGLRGFLAAGRADAIVFESNRSGPLASRPEARLLLDHAFTIAEVPKSLGRPRLAWLTADATPRGHDLVAVHPSSVDAADRLGLSPPR